MKNDPPPEKVAVLVLGKSSVWFGRGVADWDAATLLACLSEDPGSWSELGLIWPRYQTAQSPELLNALPMREFCLETGADQLRQSFRAAESWLVIDLIQKRTLGGGGYAQMARDTCFELAEPNQAPLRLPVHLPPWWEVVENANLSASTQARTSPLEIPQARREVLWGKPLADGLAKLLLQEADKKQWHSHQCDTNTRARYPHTVAVHRDWLMTPHAELDGKMPRTCLHGGIEWLDHIVEGQRLRIATQGESIPISQNILSYQTGPMGREEVCTYFDCCRALISRGWEWIADQRIGTRTEAQHAETQNTLPRKHAANNQARQLSNVLAQAQEKWLHSPQEEEGIPMVNIQRERSRVPQIAVSPGENHMGDCDCPACTMQSQGALGPVFSIIDGHHLELDDEFAFSLYETYEEWEMMRSDHDFDEIEPTQSDLLETDSNAMGPMEMESLEKEPNENRLLKEEDTAGQPQKNSFRFQNLEDSQEETTSRDEAYASTWQNAHVNWESMQQTPLANMAISFLLADMVDSLQENKSPPSDILQLNEAFRTYRETFSAHREKSTREFQHTLEEIACRNEFLIARSADLQSKLEELRRTNQAPLG